MNMQLQTIESKIYTLRGQKVMLDRDLAAMYGVETRRLNEQVRRNLRRFEGDDFMFQLSQQEFEDWKSQFATSNSIKMGMRKKPYAFTELGVAMLSSVLHSDIAIEINKSIMRAFVTIRQTLSSVPTDAIGGLQREILELRQYEAVRRNSRRFPMDFMFELTNDEWQSLRSQIASSKRGGIRYAPFAFTEWGVAMLSSVINTDVSIEINIGIMKAFVAVRQMLVSRPADKIEELREYVEEIVADQNDINEDTRMQLELINQTLAEMQAGRQTDNTPRRRVGY